ncbi:MAG TPA: ABC transporter permease, partial [Acidobacteriaceae bacterium]
MRIWELTQDLRYAWRQLRKSPGFAFTAVAVLALGIGANVAVFTLISGILLRPLPYPKGDRIVEVNAPQESEDQRFNMLLSYADLKQLADAAGSTVKTGILFDSRTASVVGPGGRYQVSRTAVSTDLIPMLGVEPVLGRGFRNEESEPGKERVLVLSDGAWRKLWNGDKQAVGKTLTIQGEVYTVVGVMPRGFAFPQNEGDVIQMWSPAPLDAAARTRLTGDEIAAGQMFARLPEGMSKAQLEANLSRVQAQIAKEDSRDNLPSRVEVKAYQQDLNQRARKPLGLLYAVVAGIWALACLNVTSLMLTRAVARSRELAVRSALGASRARLVQQSIVESLLLSSLGAVAGALLGQVALKVLWTRIERSLPMTGAVQMDWRVICGMAALTLLTALIVGLFPALRATRRNVQDDLHGVKTTATASQNRTRELLVVAQLALTLVFLTGAGLFLRTIHALRQAPLGFVEQNVLTGGVILHPGISNGHAGDVNVVQTMYEPLLEKLRAIPGVKQAALSSVLPMRSEFAVMFAMDLDGKKVPMKDAPRADGRLASAGLVEAMGIPMVKGRFFTDSDTKSSPVVAVVNEAFAKKYLPGQDATQHTISMGKGRFASIHIVGVMADVKQEDVTKQTRPEVYFCLPQMEPGAPLYNIATAFIEVAIRGVVPADTLRARFDKALHEVAPDATTTDVKTIHEAVEDSFGNETMISYLLEGFAGLALLIASVGLYGLLSFAVAQRTREIGLRLALGAQR